MPEAAAKLQHCSAAFCVGHLAVEQGTPTLKVHDHMLERQFPLQLSLQLHHDMSRMHLDGPRFHPIDGTCRIVAPGVAGSMQIWD